MRAARTEGACSPPPAPSLAIAGLVTGCTAGAEAAATPAPRTTPTTTRPARRSRSASPAPPPTTAGSAPSTRRPSPRPRSTTTSNSIVAEGTNDANLQISQVETFINDGVDAIVLLPTDGAALTEVAIKAMEAGIPVINVDREFSSTFAARVTILGDNYGMGVSAGTYICEQLGDNPDAVVAEIAGIDSLPLTQDRSRGFADALEDCGLEVSNRVAADFTVAGWRGRDLAAARRRAADRRAVEPRRRPGCRRPRGDRRRRPRRVLHGRRRRLEERDGRHQGRRQRARRRRSSTRRRRAPTASASPASSPRARRSATSSRSDVPTRIVLYAPVVTEENVDQYLPTAFAS